MKGGTKISKNIPLHQKYGLNPTISTCFYCGKEKNEIALLGANYKGKAPMHMITNLEPCDECKARYVNYTLLVEMDWDWKVRSGQRKRVNERPTGRWCAIRKECLNIKPTPVAFVEPETMNLLIAQAQETEMAT